MSQVFGLIPSNPTSIAMATFIQSLAPLNSAANPLIYCLFSANTSKYFRSAFMPRDKIIYIRGCSSIRQSDFDPSHPHLFNNQ